MALPWENSPLVTWILNTHPITRLCCQLYSIKNRVRLTVAWPQIRGSLVQVLDIPCSPNGVTIVSSVPIIHYNIIIHIIMQRRIPLGSMPFYLRTPVPRMSLLCGEWPCQTWDHFNSTISRHYRVEDLLGTELQRYSASVINLLHAYIARALGALYTADYWVIAQSGMPSSHMLFLSWLINY